MKRNAIQVSLSILVMLLTLLLLPAFAEGPVGKRLSAPEITKTISGNTSRFVSKRGGRYVTFWRDDGTMLGMGESTAAKKTVPGTWKVTEDGQLCLSWSNSKWDGGCRTLFLDEKTGEIQLYNSEGTAVMKFTEILPGNPDKLY